MGSNGHRHPWLSDERESQKSLQTCPRLTPTAGVLHVAAVGGPELLSGRQRSLRPPQSCRIKPRCCFETSFFFLLFFFLSDGSSESQRTRSPKLAKEARESINNDECRGELEEGNAGDQLPQCFLVPGIANVDSLQSLHARRLHSHRQQREIAVELFLVSSNK